MLILDINRAPVPFPAIGCNPGPLLLQPPPYGVSQLFRLLTNHLKHKNRAPVQVPWPPMKVALQGPFHEMRSRAIPVPLRDIHKQSYKMLNIHELSSRAGPVASRERLS